MKIENKLDLSIVIPCFNEKDNLLELHSRIQSALSSTNLAHEKIFVDDGSTDGSHTILENLKDKDLRLIRFVANAGHMAAIDAGYRSSKGKYVITMDADLQHPPELIIEMYKKAQETQSDVIYAYRKHRKEDSFFKRVTASLYYSIIKYLTGVQIISHAADYRLVSDQVVEAIRQIPSGQIIYRILIPKLGFKSDSVEFEAPIRYAGKSKYSTKKMFSMFFDSVSLYSNKPLIISIRIGFIFSIISLVGIFYTLIVYFTQETITGWSSIVSIIFALFGVQFVLMGVLGKYLSQVWNKINGIPNYIIRNEAPN